MAEEQFYTLTDAEVEEVRQFFEVQKTQSMSCTIEKLEEFFSQLDAVKLNIAVTGECGSGKSSFVNAIRDLGDDDELSAKTGVVETTKEPTPYTHPRHPNIIIWDLPGIGTENFKARDYLEKVRFDMYDVFILITADRFKSSSVDLAKAIEERSKKFYFLRTRIDENIRAEKRKRTFNEEEVLNRIRTDCLQGLKVCSVACPKVFLISSHEIRKYDFSVLVETLENELPRHKKGVLLSVLPNICLSVHQKKRDLLQARVWKVALRYAVSLSDTSILQAEMTKYSAVFGLNDDSLERLSDQTDVPVEELKACVTSPLNSCISAEVVERRLSEVAGRNRVETVLNFIGIMVSLFPVLASVPLVAKYFFSARCMLQACLGELADDAHKVLCRALQTPV